MEWETYDSDFSITLNESDTSTSSHQSLECQLMIDYLNVGRLIEYAPYITWRETLDSSESLYKLFGDMKRIVGLRPELEESLHAYLKNNRLTYILDKVVLGSLQLQEMTTNMFVFNKLHSMSSLVESVFDFAESYAIRINDQLVVNLLIVLQGYRHFENQFFTNHQLQILQKKPKGLNKIILVVLSHAYPTLLLFKFIQQQFVTTEPDTRRISQLLKDFSVLLANLRVKVEHDYDEVPALDGIKGSVESMIAFILRSSYHKSNWYVFQQIQTDFKALFPGSYFNDSRFITPAFNSDLDDLTIEEAAAPWLRDVFVLPPDDKEEDPGPEIEVKPVTEIHHRPHRVNPILTKVKSKLTKWFSSKRHAK
ncbi:hypothetical protein Cantr_01399 [Candida viswanathii]|uniref:Uncharacterized protein n=1 Tax=Candida viswanathii TaxID=5486 RepID=A0A367YKQ6_9ASCO|nr:hypothetical protein Cantr_01399 [Candida viswanathii]